MFSCGLLIRANNKVDGMEYYYSFSTDSAQLFVLASDTKAISFEDTLYESEGCSLSPPNYTREEFNGEAFQWTGRLFKDKPPVFFGFQWFSFGCPYIDLIQTPGSIVPILCDNRH